MAYFQKRHIYLRVKYYASFRLFFLFSFFLCAFIIICTLLVELAEKKTQVRINLLLYPTVAMFTSAVNDSYKILLRLGSTKKLVDPLIGRDIRINETNEDNKIRKEKIML